jgi:hypothetical protein
MRVTRISVALEQRLGDNDYGSERAQVEYSAELGADDDALDCMQKLLWQARVQLLLEVSNSRTLAIRRKANPPARLCAECKQPLGDEDDYRHPACEEAMLERRKQQEEERRAKYETDHKEREAEYQRQRELAGVGAATDDDDEPDDDEDLPL